MSRRALLTLLVALLAAYSAQQALAPVIGPLSRSLALPDVAVGWVMTLAAVAFAATSVLWGRAVGRWGHRPVLLGGLAGGALALVGFAVVVAAALEGVLDPGVALVLMLVTRSLGFGTAMGAVPVAVTSWVAARTSGQDRVAALGRVGAAQAVAIALGPAVGGALGVLGLLGPVVAAPVMVVLALLAVLLWRPTAPAAHPVPATPGATAGALRPWDRRAAPWLLTCVLVMLSLAMVLVVLAFLVQDRVGADPAQTVRLTGLVSFVSGVVMVLTQGVVVPALRWAPARLVATGLPLAVVGLVGLALAPDLVTITAALAVTSLGLGLTTPGYTAGATLAVAEHEQSSVAGLISLAGGTGFVLGPLLGTALYSWHGAAPALVAAGLCAAGATAVLARGHRSRRAAAQRVHQAA